MRERWHAVADRPVRSLVLGEPVAGVPEVVVVPGLGALGYLLPTLEACAAWTRVHLLDLPGFGHRCTARCPSALADVAASAAAWLEEAVARPVLLVGHSTGAQSAARAALDVPHRVQGLVLAGATFPPELRSLLRLVLPVARTLIHESPRELPGVLPEYLRGRSRVLVLLRSALADRPEDAVAGVAAPLTVLRGEHDRLCPEVWAQQLADLVAEGRAVTLPGAHNNVFTHPTAVAAAVRDAAGGASSWTSAGSG